MATDNQDGRERGGEAPRPPAPEPVPIAVAYGGAVDSGLDVLVGAYWRYQEMRGGDRAQRLGADEHWWAVEAVQDAVRVRSVGEVVEMLDQLLGAPGADLIFIGAGPLEDLLHDRPDAADAVAHRCQSSQRAPQWRAAISAVWLTGYHHDRLPALARFLSPPIDRPRGPWTQRQQQRPPPELELTENLERAMATSLDRLPRQDFATVAW